MRERERRGGDGQNSVVGWLLLCAWRSEDRESKRVKKIPHRKLSQPRQRVLLPRVK